MIESQPPVSVKEASNGNRVFADIIVKIRLLGYAHSQYEWCPYKKEKDRGTRKKRTV